jgi:hypothetical protein
LFPEVSGNRPTNLKFQGGFFSYAIDSFHQYKATWAIGLLPRGEGFVAGLMLAAARLQDRRKTPSLSGNKLLRLS